MSVTFGTESGGRPVGAPGLGETTRTRGSAKPSPLAIDGSTFGAAIDGVTAALHDAKRLGVTNVGTIAEREAKRLGLGAGYCRRYLTNVIRYDLGPRELAGLRKFSAWATELGLIPKGEVRDEQRTTLVESR